MVRSAMPEIDAAGFTIASLKNDFPLKCKTNVIEITEKDVEDGKVDGIIGDALAECWFVFGSGDANVFAANVYMKTTTCIPCARIHLTNKAKSAVVDGKIDISGILNDKSLFDLGGKKTSYLNYLNGVGKLFEPFNPAFNNPFNLSGDKFVIDASNYGKGTKRVKDGSEIGMEGGFASVSLPKYLDVAKGDLIIALGELTDSGSDKTANYIPYMFYFQNGQDDYPEQMKKDFFSAWTDIDSDICNSWEGIPA